MCLYKQYASLAAPVAACNQYKLILPCISLTFAGQQCTAALHAMVASESTVLRRRCSVLKSSVCCVRHA